MVEICRCIIKKLLYKNLKNKDIRYPVDFRNKRTSRKTSRSSPAHGANLHMLHLKPPTGTPDELCRRGIQRWAKQCSCCRCSPDVRRVELPATDADDASEPTLAGAGAAYNVTYLLLTQPLTPELVFASENVETSSAVVSRSCRRSSLVMAAWGNSNASSERLFVLSSACSSSV
jgi:hypothetical protein